MRALNAVFDSLPRTRFGCLGRDMPAYRALGIVGFYLALIVVFAGGLLTGRSLPVLAGLALACALSFFAYAYLRRWISGHEHIVLLEHVWFALGTVAAVLWVMRQPVEPYLDIVSVGLCFFLAAGRAGCTLVGCCHGRPSSLGIVYGDEAVAGGFPRHFAGVRLFPLPLVELLGLLLIGTTGLAALAFARPGIVSAWFLLSYAAMRFGLEGLRGDPRPEFLGLSQSRWMVLAQAACALWIVEGGPMGSVRIAVVSGLAVAVVCGAALIHHFDWRRTVLDPAHVLELRAAVGPELPDQPLARRTTRAVTVAASDSGAAFGAEAHVSLSFGPGRSDLELLCRLAARAFPDSPPDAASLGRSGVLHLLVPVPLAGGEVPAGLMDERGRALYGAVVRRAQRPAEPQRQPWYFTVAGQG